MNYNCNDITAIVEHSYTQKEPDELSLVKGETIYKINKLSGGWWQGVNSSGKKGMFPENFVRVVNENEVILRDKSSTVYRKCKAIYSYDQNKEDELTLAVGDVVEILGEAEEGWWQGQLNGKKGVFPSNFVTLLEPSSVKEKRSGGLDKNVKELNKSVSSSKTIIKTSNETNLNLEVPSLPPKRQKEFCQVEFAYSPQNEDELELVVGDIITIVSKDAQDAGWWKGEIHGKVGVFPDNFVKLLPPEGISKSVSSSKIYIKSDQKNTNFGSRDSLKDILNETGLQIGNVVQQRLSLENKNLDLSNGPSENIVLKSPNSDSEMKKSTESLDDKKNVPPTLPKKPTVPVKKTGSVSTVAGNIISGFKKSVKKVEQNIQASVSSTSQDTSDGLSSSKLEIADNYNKNVKIERIKQQDEDFDNVERTTNMLQDVRATRVKAPKRRPPTSSNNSVGNENNNYINGTSYNESVEVVRNQINIKTEKEETNRISKNIPAKMNAPWMAELKANQEKKKISVNKENVSNNVESSSSLRSVSTSIKENVVMSETLTSRSIVTTTSTTNNLENQIQNQKVPNKPIIVEKEKTTVVAPPTGPTTLLSQAKKEKVESNVENSSNILIQNNNTINTSSIESQDNTESSKVIELEKRVQALESIVEQLRKELLFLKNVNENHSIVKSEIEKYV